MVLRKDKDLYSRYSSRWYLKWKMREARWVGMKNIQTKQKKKWQARV